MRELGALERFSVVRLRIYASIVAILTLLVSNLPVRAEPPHLVALGDSLTAGLGLEASLDRISREIIKQSRALGMNLLLLGAETRAGRSTIDALASFADRLRLDAARVRAA